MFNPDAVGYYMTELANALGPDDVSRSLHRCMTESADEYRRHRLRLRCPRFGTVHDVMGLVIAASGVPPDQQVGYGYSIVAKLTEKIVGRHDAVDLACALAALSRERLAKPWLTFMPAGGEQVFVTALICAVEDAVAREDSKQRERVVVVSSGDEESEADEHDHNQRIGSSRGVREPRKRRVRPNEPPKETPKETPKPRVECPIMGPNCLGGKVGAAQCGHLICVVCWDNRVRSIGKAVCPTCRKEQDCGTKLFLERVFW